MGLHLTSQFTTADNVCFLIAFLYYAYFTQHLLLLLLCIYSLHPLRPMHIFLRHLGELSENFDDTLQFDLTSLLFHARVNSRYTFSLIQIYVMDLTETIGDVSNPIHFLTSHVLLITQQSKLPDLVILCGVRCLAGVRFCGSKVYAYPFNVKKRKK